MKHFCRNQFVKRWVNVLWVAILWLLPACNVDDPLLNMDVVDPDEPVCEVEGEIWENPVCIEAPVCSEDDPDAFPGQFEVCDGEDNDCNGFTDERYFVNSDPNHCGACNQVCNEHGFLRDGCYEGQCVFVNDNWTEQLKMFANPSQELNGFGYAMALDGNRLLVGAGSQTVDGMFASGAAFVFEGEGDTWVEKGVLLPDDEQESSYFGASGALDGNFAVVGSPYHDFVSGGEFDRRVIRYVGAAYVFQWNGVSWDQVDKLAPEILLDNNRPYFNNVFGEAVAISGNHLAVGAYGPPLPGAQERRIVGVVHMFELEDGQWQPRQVLRPNQGEHTRMFGHSLSLQGSRLLIGSPDLGTGLHNPDQGHHGPGAAFVFDYNGDQWVETQVLTAANGEVGDAFGYSVSLDGGRALVGAIGNDFLEDEGSAYIFDLDEDCWVDFAFDPDFPWDCWQQTVMLEVNDTAPGDRFGLSVSLSGDRALLGSLNYFNEVRESGKAYLFELVEENWNRVHRFEASDAMPGDGFGGSVTLNRHRAMVSAQGVTTRFPVEQFGPDRADRLHDSVYVFELLPQRNSFVQNP